MRLFNCKVRLSGSLYNEVLKNGVSIAEIIVLRAIHGGDSVTSIEEADAVDRDDTEERERLGRRYAVAIQNKGIQGGLGALVGFGGPLPDGAPGVPAEVKRGSRKPAEKPAKVETPVKVETPPVDGIGLED